MDQTRPAPTGAETPINAPFRFQRQGRSWGAAVGVGAVCLALLAAWIVLDAAWWILAFPAAFTLPAIWDLARNPSSGLTLDDAGLAWHSGRRHAFIALDEIDHMRLDTRLDFSVRATVVPKTARRIRLPFESTPPADALEQALAARGVAVQRHHFQLLQ